MSSSGKNNKRKNNRLSEDNKRLEEIILKEMGQNISLIFAKKLIINRSGRLIKNKSNKKRLKNSSKKTVDEEQKKILLAARELIGEVDNETTANPEKGLSQRAFHVAINMNRIGRRRIRQIVFGGRPPTNYDGRGQGPHIVAYTLLEAAIRGQLVGSYLIPEKEEQKGDDAIEGLRNITEFDGNGKKSVNRRGGPAIDGGTIKAKLEELKQKRDTPIPVPIKPQAVRKKLSLLRQDMNIATENIIRSWNQRGPYVVYQSKLDILQELDDPKKRYPGPKLKAVDIFGIGIDNRESFAVKESENLDLVEEIINLDLKNSAEDGATEGLEAANDGSGDSQQNISKLLARFIDIKSPQEFNLETLEIQFGGEGKDMKKNREHIKKKYGEETNKGTFVIKEKIQEEYNKVLESSIEEAARLGKLAYPNLVGKIDEDEIKNKGILEATKEDLKKRIKGNSKKKKIFKERLKKLSQKNKK